MQTTTLSSSDNSPLVKVIGLKFSPPSFELKDESCSNLNEYFTESYAHLKHQLQVILVKKYTIKVELSFDCVFTESPKDQYRQIEHFFSYTTEEKWIHSITDINEDYYNSFIEGVLGKIASDLPRDVDAYPNSITTYVFIKDLDDSLD